jgi:hypothetical protein
MGKGKGGWPSKHSGKPSGADVITILQRNE